MINLRKKSILANFQKGGKKTGFYANTLENRKLGIVGMKYKKEKEDFYQKPEVKAYYKKIQEEIDKHNHELEVGKRKKNPVDRDIRKKIQAKREKWETSDKYFQLKRDIKSIKDDMSDLNEVLIEHEMQEEEVLYDAQKIGFDDPFDYKDYKDWVDQKNSYKKELKDYEGQIKEIENKLNRYN